MAEYKTWALMGIGKDRRKYGEVISKECTRPQSRFNEVPTRILIRKLVPIKANTPCWAGPEVSRSI